MNSLVQNLNEVQQLISLQITPQVILIRDLQEHDINGEFLLHHFLALQVKQNDFRVPLIISFQNTFNHYAQLQRKITGKPFDRKDVDFIEALENPLDFSFHRYFSPERHNFILLDRLSNVFCLDQSTKMEKEIILNLASLFKQARQARASFLMYSCNGHSEMWDKYLVNLFSNEIGLKFLVSPLQSGGNSKDADGELECSSSINEFKEKKLLFKFGRNCQVMFFPKAL
jgi:hypothetical protein